MRQVSFLQGWRSIKLRLRDGSESWYRSLKFIPLVLYALASWYPRPIVCEEESVLAAAPQTSVLLTKDLFRRACKSDSNGRAMSMYSRTQRGLRWRFKGVRPWAPTLRQEDRLWPPLRLVRFRLMEDPPRFSRHMVVDQRPRLWRKPGGDCLKDRPRDPRSILALINLIKVEILDL